ncbi:non-structural maintenance of chromosomes element 1 homolog [Anoplophora glabripennis]|uniref:non-structural maintenance of chromosomes element 1 homolog n=1 Tax=Anoplophora glabripennis TaxID=217634 RepID=UPI0008743278|nr:non-structural maintenance of chromosomes element 1 homolog [Anoplophora glabripennis]
MNIYHRYFVQYMLQNGTSTVNNAITYCRHVSQGKVDSMTHLKTLVIEINREISKQFYKIVFFVCEVTNQNVVIWLNTKNDDISKHQISFSTIELEYFDSILKEILNSEEHRITFIVCINITSTLTSQFSRDSGQTVLNKWLKGGYYVKRGDYIHLGPRTILEFTAYLRSNCPDSLCNLCSEIVFTGKKCNECNKLLHSHCLSTYLSNQNVCPCCRNEWTQASEEETQDEYMDTNGVDSNSYSVETNGTLHNDEETSQDSSTQSEHMSQVLISNSTRRNQRTRHSQQNDISDIDEPGPSTRKRHRRYVSARTKY